MSETAVGYTRLSQRSDTSIPRQKDHIREYCDDHNLTLERIYDDGEESSGFDASREEYRELRDRVREGEVDAVVVNDKRRLARDVDEVMRLVPDLRTEDVELHTYQDGPLDLSDPMQASIEILMAAAAYEEKIEEIEKSINAIKEKKERGDDLGRPRFGMTYDEEKRRQVPGDRWEDVVEIFEMRENGHTYEEIAVEVGISTGTAYRVVDRREWYEKRAGMEIESV
jgi:DNA invertase Pin-like site-specific DNA recombinase